MGHNVTPYGQPSILPPQTGPSDQGITSGSVSSGGMIDAYAGIGQGCEPVGTAPQWIVRPTAAPGASRINVAGRPVSRRDQHRRWHQEPDPHDA